MSLGNLVANLGLNRRGWSRGLDRARGDLRSFAGGVKSLLAPVAGLVGGALAAGASIGAAREQIAAEAKLAAVLKATGGAAGLSAKEIGTYASELQDMTNIGDEVTIAGSAVLATFKEVKGAQFKDALAIMGDMNAVLGTDMKASAIQVGKALNDPIKGVTALADAGVSFTAQQREQIRALQESGDMMGAQKIILDELKSEFGGAAAAVADPMTQAGNVLGDVAEVVGFVLLPPLNAVMKLFSESAGPVTNSADSFKALGATLGELTETGLKPVFETIQAGASWVVDAADLIGYALQNAGDLATLGLLTIADGLAELAPLSSDTSSTVAANLIGAFSGTRAVAMSFVDAVRGGLEELMNVGQAVASAIYEAFQALTRGENPLSAFADSFVETLANQKDVAAPNIAKVMSETFSEAKKQAEENFAKNGGIAGALAIQRDQVLARMGEREVAQNAAKLKPLALPVVPQGGDDDSSSVSADSKPGGPGALLKGAEATFEKLRMRQLGQTDAATKAAELAKQQLETQIEIAENSAVQVASLKKISESSGFVSGGFD